MGDSRVTLVLVDSNVTACGDIGHAEDCGYVHVLSEIVGAEDLLGREEGMFVWRRTGQKGYRVVSAVEDAERFYVTGGRSWPAGRGTSVWKATYNDDDNNDDEGSGFGFELVFLQVDVDNGYALWPKDRLEYSAVGLDVGYWDGGYYTFAVNPRNSSEAGGSGNFFLHGK